MKLRIIAGELRSRILQIPDGLPFRPTLERVRQAAADALSFAIPDARVADLCAGSGAFGFELLSRGARHVTFCESNRHLANAIKKHAELFRITDRSTLYTGDVKQFCQSADHNFDIVFYDPPYDNPALTDMMFCLDTLAPKGILLFQRDENIAPPPASLTEQGYTITTRQWGRTIIDYICAKDA